MKTAAATTQKATKPRLQDSPISKSRTSAIAGMSSATNAVATSSRGAHSSSSHGLSAAPLHFPGDHGRQVDGRAPDEQHEPIVLGRLEATWIQ